MANLKEQKNQYKVALVVPGLAYGRRGGIASVAGFLFHVLASSKCYNPELISLATSSRDPFSVRLLAPSSWSGGVQKTEFSWNTIPAIHIGAKYVELEFQRYRPSRALIDFLSNYDLVQIVAGSPALGILGKNISVPVVIQVATLVAVERETELNREGNAKRAWTKLMTRITNHLDHEALHVVDHIFVENDWMYRYCVNQVGAQRVTFAPPGVDINIFSAADEFPLGGFILSVGRFGDPRKNVGLLFKAYHNLQKLMPNPPLLVLAGRSMPSAADWHIALELGIADRVQLLEDLSTNELAELYRRARLFVLTSNEEGFGIVLLEAMASAIPVVATRCGGPEGVVIEGETGFLVPVGDPEN